MPGPCCPARTINESKAGVLRQQQGLPQARGTEALILGASKVLRILFARTRIGEFTADAP